MLSYLRNNFTYRLLSLIAAILIWFFVFSERNPITENVVTIPLETIELSSDLVLEQKPNTVSIRFQGKSNVVERVTSRDFSAHISLEDASIGVNTLQVVTEMPSGIRLISVQPSWVQVSVDQIETIQMPVDLRIQGEPAEGYTLERPRITPNQVLVKGPGSYLEQISAVFVVADCRNVSMDFFQTLPLLVEDQAGNLMMDWVEVVPRIIEVYIPVVENIPNRNIPILLDFIGETQPGILLNKHYIYPGTVRIYGPQERINEINYIMLEIDVSTVVETTTLDIEIPLPEGITDASDRNVQILLEVTDEN